MKKIEICQEACMLFTLTTMFTLVILQVLIILLLEVQTLRDIIFKLFSSQLASMYLNSFQYMYHLLTV